MRVKTQSASTMVHIIIFMHYEDLSVLYDVEGADNLNHCKGSWPIRAVLSNGGLDTQPRSFKIFKAELLPNRPDFTSGFSYSLIHITYTARFIMFRPFLSRIAAMLF